MSCERKQVILDKPCNLPPYQVFLLCPITYLVIFRFTTFESSRSDTLASCRLLNLLTSTFGRSALVGSPGTIGSTSGGNGFPDTAVSASGGSLRSMMLAL